MFVSRKPCFPHRHVSQATNKKGQSSTYLVELICERVKQVEQEKVAKHIRYRRQTPLGVRQTRRWRVCRQTLVRVATRGASDTVSRERQTRPGTLLQRLSLERVERGATSRVRRVCRLRTGRVCRVSHETSSLDCVYRAYGRVCRSALDASVAWARE
jgi:hypothetical protein